VTAQPQAKPTDEVVQILDALDKYLDRKSHLLAERRNYERCSKQWKRDVGLHPGALRPLLNANLVPSLVTVKYPGTTGSAFFLPVVVAWIVLGIVELRYAASGSRESFFTWWTGQGILGPHVYSFVIAGVLVVALFLHFGRTGSSRLAEEVDARLARDGAVLAALVGQLLESEAEAKPAAADRASIALTRAADRLGGVADSLGGVADSLQLDREAIKDYTTAAADARTTMATLSELTGKLAATSKALADALASLPAAMQGATAQVGPITDALDGLGNQAVTLQRQSDGLSRHLETLVTKVLPDSASVADKAVGAASLAASSAPAVEQAAAALTAAYQQLAAHQKHSAELVDKAQRVLSYIEEGPIGAAGRDAWPPQ